MKTLQAVAILLACAGVAVAQQNSNTKPAPPTTGAAKRVRADTKSFDLEPAPSQGGPTMGAGSRGGGGATAELYAPGLGLTFSTQPVFYWQAQKGAGATTFRLNDDGDNELYETDVTGKSSLIYPDNAPELKPGATYSWSVDAKGVGVTEPPPPTRFKVVSGADRQKVQEELANVRGNGKDDRVKRAQIFASNGLWYDAIAAYSQLIADYPKDAQLYQARAEIYDAVPRTKELGAEDLASAKAAAK
jgi:hypothetical protein